MNLDAKIIKPKQGLLELSRQLGSNTSVQNLWLFQRQFLPF